MNQVCDLLSVMKQRAERTMEVQEATLKFLKQATRVLGPMASQGSPLVTTPARNSCEDGATDTETPTTQLSVVWEDGTDLTKLGGDTHVRMARNIAKKVLNGREGMKKYVLDPKHDMGTKKRKKCSREPAPDNATERYKKAVKIVFGEAYTASLYTETLRLVNQAGNDYNAYDREKVSHRSSVDSVDDDVVNENDLASQQND